jgi:hypothetical protein
MKAIIDIPKHFEKFLREQGMNDNEIQMNFAVFMEDMFEESNSISTELVHWYEANFPD